MAFRQNIFRKKELIPTTNLIEKSERKIKGNLINQRSGSMQYNKIPTMNPEGVFRPSARSSTNVRQEKRALSTIPDTFGAASLKKKTIIKDLLNLTP